VNVRYTQRLRWESKWMVVPLSCRGIRPLPPPWTNSHLCNCPMLVFQMETTTQPWWIADNPSSYLNSNKKRSPTSKTVPSSKRWNNSRSNRNKVPLKPQPITPFPMAVSQPSRGETQALKWARTTITRSHIWCLSSSQTRSRTSWSTWLCPSAKPGHPDASRSFHASLYSWIEMAGRLKAKKKWIVLVSKTIWRNT